MVYLVDDVVVPSVHEILNQKIENKIDTFEDVIVSNAKPKPTKISASDELDIAVGTFMTYGGRLIRKVGSYFVDKETGLIPYMDVFQPLGMSSWIRLEKKLNLIK